NDFDRFRINSVLFFQNSGAERFVRVVVFDRDNGLQNDRPRVEIFVNEMDRATGEFYAVIESLFLCFEAGKGWEQRWMNVQNFLREGRDEIGREQTHITG